MRTFFDYCYYRISKAYRSLSEKSFCDWGFGVLATTLGFYALMITTFILHLFNCKLNREIIIIVLVPFILIDGIFSFFYDNKKKIDKYEKLEKRYSNDCNRIIKGLIAFLFVIGSLFSYIAALLICGYWVKI